MHRLTWLPQQTHFHTCAVCLLHPTAPAESGHCCSNCVWRHIKDQERVIQYVLNYTDSFPALQLNTVHDWLFSLLPIRVHTRGYVYPNYMQTFSSSMGYPIKMKLHRGIEKCQWQRLMKPFVSLTHCPCLFCVSRKTFAHCNKMMHFCCIMMLLTELQKNLAMIQCLSKTILFRKGWFFDPWYCSLQHSTES